MPVYADSTASGDVDSINDDFTECDIDEHDNFDDLTVIKG